MELKTGALRWYQSKAVEMVRDEIRKGNKRILVQQATGSGKSHVMGAIATGAVNKGNKVLCLMHRRGLVTQLCERFGEIGLDCDMIMSGVECKLESQIQVATMQTYGRRMNLDSLDRNRFWVDAPVIMIDEAHHALSKTYQKILENYKDRIVIGVTATPVLASGLGMGNYFQAIVSPVSIQQLMDEKHLVPAVYYGPSAPDLSKVRTTAGDYNSKDLEKTMNQPKLIGDVVENWLRLGQNKQTMVFAVKVNHSKALCEEFNRRGVAAEHLDAHDEDEDREGVLKRFRDGDTRVICNVGLYTEGTDIREIECIVLARPTKSLGFHLQMVGRGARPYPGKDSFTVLDHGGNVERLGFYEDEIEWSLDGKCVGYRKKVERKKEKKILSCDMCSTLFTGPRCTYCGYEIKDYGKKIEAVEADLVQIGKKAKRATPEEKRRFFGMLRYQQRAKGYSDGWSAHKFRERFGVWPNAFKHTEPMEPDQEFQNYMRYLNIKWAKSKRREEAQQCQLGLGG